MYSRKQYPNFRKRKINTTGARNTFGVEILSPTILSRLWLCMMDAVVHGRLAKWRKSSGRKVGEWAVTWVKRRKTWRMSCDEGEAHSPTFPSPHLRHSSCSNPSVALLTSQIILQSFFRFSYVTGSSLTSPGEPPMCCVFIRTHGRSENFYGNRNSKLYIYIYYMNDNRPTIIMDDITWKIRNKA